MGYFGRFYQQLRSAFGEMPVPRQIFTGLVLMGTLAGLTYLIAMAQRPEYVAIYHSLRPEDASKIDSIVRTMNVTPHWQANQTTLLVPANRADEVRLRLHGDGLRRYRNRLE